MYRKLFFLLILSQLFACSDAAPQQETTVAGTSYPPLPEEIRKSLLETCDYIDITFYNYPISTSQDVASSIQPSMTYWDPEGATIPNTCRAAGHIWYQSKGNNIREADFYFSPDCFYYVFYENGKPAYANPINARGLAFFERILTPFMKK